MLFDTSSGPKLIAATFTPFHPDCSINTDAIPIQVDFLIEHGISGLYILGSTGEGLSLTMEERQLVATRFVDAVDGRIPVIVQVGSECLQQSRELASHAQQIGADAISAVSPVYFKPESATVLVESMQIIASGAPSLPFYYYHIPGVTGVTANIYEFLELASRRIENFQGIKFTSPNIHEFQRCLERAGNRYEIMWGVDEMLLSGLASGANLAIGSTYNFAANVSLELIQAYQKGDMNLARQLQARTQALVETFLPYGPRVSQKVIMSLAGHECGPSRLPLRSMLPEERKSLEVDLAAIGFFDWISCSKVETAR
ncbi:dihydrodipicolinate synthase family protein [Calycomorphotria hydatis]|uniref:N-acetylneuraminate lyase n=1 Tax=Calycomorphotria hydatis TaxID=2528027 RepID=A0A517T9W7_9PLAN|nr:dihydrodipicolinate synthase family protein [Calycomorphotria hydatis]QDT65168.1 N-acetylneuraminate lyase [Calycomorphotria hydatis]